MPKALTREEFRAQMLQYLERDKAAARAQPCILGFKVWSRGDDWPCARAASFTGLYLVDELPDLYPADCEPEWGFDVCACVLREFVLSVDTTPEAEELRRRKKK